MSPIRYITILLMLSLSFVRPSFASTFNFSFTPTKVLLGMSLEASGTFSVESGQYSDVTGTVNGSNITGIDTSFPQYYNPAFITFIFDADNGKAYLINGAPYPSLSDDVSIVAGRFSATPVSAVPLPPALPLFGLAVLVLVLGKMRSKPGWTFRRILAPQPQSL